MTGVTPAEHGVTGNEYFIRERRELACPAPVSFTDTDATLAVYTDHTLDQLVEAPTVYELMRRREPNIQIWVAMNHLFRGADHLLIAKKSAIAKAFGSFVEHAIVKATDTPASPRLYERLDAGAIDAVVDHLAKDPLPDVLTLYISGTDLYAHIAEQGPDRARRAYMQLIDKQFGRIADALLARQPEAALDEPILQYDGQLLERRIEKRGAREAEVHANDLAARRIDVHGAHDARLPVVLGPDL